MKRCRRGMVTDYLEGGKEVDATSRNVAGSLLQHYSLSNLLGKLRKVRYLTFPSFARSLVPNLNINGLRWSTHAKKYTNCTILAMSYWVIFFRLSLRNLLVQIMEVCL